MWIKICGMTTAEAVAAALEAKADAIGFVFAESVRRVTPESALRLSEPARGRMRCVAVMRHPQQQALDQVLAHFKPDVLQTDAEDLASLDLPSHLEVLPVIRAGRPASTPLPHHFLFEGPVSGSGEPCDWTRAAELACTHELILAGGLQESNITLAIKSVRPFGVDVSSGVEDSPGIKSAQKIARFVKAARAAQGQI